MVTRAQKRGKSQGLRLSKVLLSEAEIEVGDAVDVTPVRRVRGGHDFREFVRRIPEDYKPEEVDWGPPVGQEIW